MERKQIFDKLNEIFQDVMDNDEIVVNDSSSSRDIDEWDSLAHIQLIIAIEKAFSVKISASEANKWENVGAMVDDLLERINK